MPVVEWGRLSISIVITLYVLKKEHPQRTTTLSSDSLQDQNYWTNGCNRWGNGRYQTRFKNLLYIARGFVELKCSCMMLALEQWLVTDFSDDKHYNKNVTKNCWTFPTLFEGCLTGGWNWLFWYYTAENASYECSWSSREPVVTFNTGVTFYSLCCSCSSSEMNNN